jgi:hypothetical protein
MQSAETVNARKSKLKNPNHFVLPSAALGLDFNFIPGLPSDEGIA